MHYKSWKCIENCSIKCTINSEESKLKTYENLSSYVCKKFE